MARRIKKRAKARTRTVTKTVVRTVKAKAKRTWRKARKSASAPVTKKDIILSVAGAGVGGIGGAIVLSKLPEAIPGMVKNGGVAALGGALTYFGIKKKNKVLMGAGLGMAAVGVRGIISGFVPTLAGYDEVPYMYEQVPQIAAPFAAPFAGEYEPLSGYEPLNAPFDGDDTI